MEDRGFREEILSAVSQALGQDRRQVQSIPAEKKSEESQYPFSSFAREFEKVGGRLFKTDLPSEVVRYVVDLIDSLEITEVALSDAAILGEVSLDQRLREHLGDSGNVVRVDRSIGKSDLLQMLGSVEVGITSCRFAISETGTMVLETGSESSRLLSLLPPIHLVVLRPNQLVGTLGHVLEKMSSETLDRAVTLVTGPSRTADIELTLTKGVHGPREIHAIFLDGD